MRTVIVIGGGVAGLQAGSFTAKAGEDTLVLDTGESLVLNTSNIQNMITHDSISGKEVLKRGKDKLEEFDGEFKEEKVEKVERIDEGLKVTTSKDEYKTEYVIVASAGIHDFLEDLDLDYVEGRDDPYLMDEHIDTDEDNKAADRVYAAGLARYWVHQTSFAIGDGTKAATNLISEINGEPYQDHDM
ncbi:FAD-dependent oxidoreductase [Candidatus Nanohalovita haloferacivicina]|uniref:FAD-dependent oxidoreductase n=1 Tax=Candidatus Nanohalovita haloferacivicina TaxID=2978046 RepID=UPI00325F957F|nr:Thioredoxin reductase (NADPH) [Candidatus Nanohalobia archaeon BNXNv]